VIVPARARVAPVLATASSPEVARASRASSSRAIARDRARDAVTARRARVNTDALERSSAVRARAHRASIGLRF
jgi:hypothetical protein